MPAPVQSGAQEGGAPQGGGSIPFLVGSNLYREAPFLTVAQLLDGNSHETVVNITPGGFLRGIVLQITGAGGVIGAGVISSDGPFSVLGSVSIEDISGGPIIYPINGTAARVKQTYFTPWEGDPAKRPDFRVHVAPWDRGPGHPRGARQHGRAGAVPPALHAQPGDEREPGLRPLYDGADDATDDHGESLFRDLGAAGPTGPPRQLDRGPAPGPRCLALRPT